MNHLPNQQKPNNYMPWAILTTLFCHFPTGLWAVYLSYKTDREWDMSLTANAIERAASAKRWTFISLGIGIASLLALLIGLNAWLYVQLLAAAVCLTMAVFHLLANIFFYGASPLVASVINFAFGCLIIAEAIGLFNLCF